MPPKPSQAIRHTLYADLNESLPMDIRITPNEEGDFTLHARANLSTLSNPITLNNFQRDLNLRLGEREFRFQADPLSNVYTCTQHVSAEELADHPFELVYKHQVLDAAQYDINRKSFTALTKPFHALPSFEIRGLSRHRTDRYPANRDALAGFDLTQHSPITDLHTHLTAQISAEDLLEVAKNNQALYPVELLRDKLGIAEDELPQARFEMKACEFVPTANERLACEAGSGMVEAVKVSDLTEAQLNKLARVLAVPVDRIYTFDSIEKLMYRFRNPLTKNDALIEPVILKVAERYQQQGVTYTEQAVTSATKADWLAKALPALEKAKETYGVDMRFLVGIPRSLPPERMLAEIRKVKLLGHSPHIMGVDFLGYEANKTQNFHWALTQLAQWVSEQQANPEYGHLFNDFVLRVHAGETGKNLDNVYEAMQVANRFNVKLRIGHGIHIDMDEDFKKLAREMAQKGLIAVEFNPDSNMALNNIDFPTDIPIQRWKELGVPFVLSTDGAGAYRTDSTQTAINMLYAGMTLQDLEAVRKYETAYIENQKALFGKMAQHFNALYPEGIPEFIAEYKHASELLATQSNRSKLPEELAGRRPILVAGASGTSWKMVTEEDQIEVETAMDMLVRLINPKTTYFATGRVKNEGITRLLDQAISRHHDAMPKDAEHFNVVGLLGGLQSLTPHLPENLTHIWPLKGGLMEVPTEMVQFLFDHDGHALYIGGGAFTRDFVENSVNKRVHFGVMKGPTGASTEKAEVLNEEYVFTGALGMIKHLMEQQPCIFRPGVDLTNEGLAKLYNQARAEVEDRHVSEDVVKMQEAVTKSWAARASAPKDKSLEK